MFYKFLLLQYKQGKLTKEQLEGFVPARISEEECQQIIAEVDG